MKRLVLILITFLSSVLFMFSMAVSPNVFAAEEPLEGIKFRDISSSGCLYANLEHDPQVHLTEQGGYVLTLDCAPIMFFNIVFWALFFAGVVALFLVIFGGFKYMTSGGEQKAVEGAKKTITWAIIGLAVILLSFAIVRFISDITGFECLTRFGFIGTCDAS